MDRSVKKQLEYRTKGLCMRGKDTQKVKVIPEQMGLAHIYFGHCPPAIAHWLMAFRRWTRGRGFISGPGARISSVEFWKGKKWKRKLLAYLDLDAR